MMQSEPLSIPKAIHNRKLELVVRNKIAAIGSNTQPHTNKNKLTISKKKTKTSKPM